MKTTDWNVPEDLLKIHPQENRYYACPGHDLLFVVYNCVEIRMGYSIGRLSILKNKENPVPAFSPPMNFDLTDPMIEFSSSGDYAFFRADLYKAPNYFSHPYVILRTRDLSFAFFPMDSAFNYRIEEKNPKTFELKLNTSSLSHFKDWKGTQIKVDELKWFDKSELSAFANYFDEFNIGPTDLKK